MIAQNDSSNLIAFEPLLSAKDAANLLSFHPVTVLKWAREGKLPCLRLGRRVAFRASQLDAWLASSTLALPFALPNLKERAA